MIEVHFGWVVVFIVAEAAIFWFVGFMHGQYPDDYN